MKLTPIALTTALLLGAIAADAAAQKNKTTCGSDVPVTVNIAGSPTDPGGYALISDGGGAYQNIPKGSNKITAIFQVNNCTHDFTLNLNFSQRSMWALLVDPDNTPFTRRGNFFNFDRVHSVPVTTTENFLGSLFCQNGWARNADGSVATNLDGTYRDNYAGCGSDAFGNYVLRGGGVSLDGDERISFARSPLDNSAFSCPNAADPLCGSDYIRVYHPTANVWILRPDGLATAAYRVWNSGDYLFVNYQYVPFEITVTR